MKLMVVVSIRTPKMLQLSAVETRHSQLKYIYRLEKSKGCSLTIPKKSITMRNLSLDTRREIDIRCKRRAFVICREGKHCTGLRIRHLYTRSFRTVFHPHPPLTSICPWIDLIKGLSLQRDKIRPS